MAKKFAPRPPLQAKSPLPWREYLIAGAIVAVCAADWAIGAHAFGLAETNIVMFFLAGVALASTRLGRGPSIAMTVASVLVFDFCFVPPHFTFAVSDSEYLITFAVMLGHWPADRRAGDAATVAAQRLATAGAADGAAVPHDAAVERALGDGVSGADGRSPAGRDLRRRDGAVCSRTGRTSSRCGTASRRRSRRPRSIKTSRAGSPTTASSPARGPIRCPTRRRRLCRWSARSHTVGAVGVRPLEQNRLLDPEQQRLLETCASLLALSLERDESVLDAQQSQIQVETEKLRNSLLSAVSHDIRTPLAGIAGASSTLAASYDSLDAATRADLLRTISEEAEALSRLVENLLHMTRLSSGKVTIDRQWHLVEEVVGSALTRMERQLVGRTIETHLDATLPMVHIDASLDRATADEPDRQRRQVLAARVGDRGLGPRAMATAWNSKSLIAAADSSRGTKRRCSISSTAANGAKPDRRGTGIGLAICRAVVDVHGGRIEARNRPGGGAVVRVTLPGGGCAAGDCRAIRRCRCLMSGSEPLIAVIEDETPIRRFLRASLTVEGFQRDRGDDGGRGTARHHAAAAGARAARSRAARLGRRRGDSPDPRVVGDADRRHLCARRRGVEDRRARRRRRRLPDEAVRRRRTAGAHPRRAPARGAPRRATEPSTPRSSSATCGST